MLIDGSHCLNVNSKHPTRVDEPAFSYAGRAILAMSSDAEFDTAEIAALREEVRELKEALAAVTLERDALQARVDRDPDPKPNEIGVAGTMANLVAPENAVARASPSKAGDAPPVFPNELFLAISRLLAPGSISLLNLARSCRALYSLLLPRLYESFSYEWLSHSTAVARQPITFPILGEIGEPSVPSGLKSVKTLDLRWDKHPSPLGLAFLCKNAVEIICSWDLFLSDSLLMVKLPNLEVLRVANFGWLQHLFQAWVDRRPQEPPGPWDGIPNLRRLVLMTLPDIAIMRFFGASLPSQAEIELDLIDFFEDWEPTQMPESFISKINSWHFGEMHHIMAVIDQFACFAPEKLESHDEPESYNDILSPEEWTKVIRLDSLKKLSLHQLSSHLLLTGLPPNLEELKVRSLNLTLESAFELAELANLLFSSTIKFRLRHFEEDIGDEESEEVNRYKAELSMWKMVEGFSSALDPSDS